MDRRESIKTMLLGTLSVPCVDERNFQIPDTADESWTAAYPIEELTPKR